LSQADFEDQRMHKIPANTLVVVADGHRARLFRNAGDANEIKLAHENDLSPQDLNDDGPSGSRPSDSTPKQSDEATFAKQLAHHLNSGALDSGYAHLALIADPATLGEIRPLLHKTVETRIVVELAKTLTNATIADIERALA
jgi:protein required for attachment to host cells